MLERRFVDFYAHASRVDRPTAEKDIILTYVLKVLSEDILSYLAFKGGTSLKKIWFGKTGRFSEDLDFTSFGLKAQEFRKKFKDVIDDNSFYGIHFKVVDEYPRDIYTLRDVDSYGAYIAYSHDWNESHFNVQVSFREKPILKIIPCRILEELYFKYCEFLPFEVPCLQREEVLAEKIRAAYQRMRSRDIYDLFLFARKPYDKVIAKELVAIKFWNVRESFDSKAEDEEEGTR